MDLWPFVRIQQHSGMTPLLQFLDVHINKPFKDQLKDQYEVWIDEGKKEYTATGKRKHASYEEIVEWVNTTWKVVATDEVILEVLNNVAILTTPEIHSFI